MLSHPRVWWSCISNESIVRRPKGSFVRKHQNPRSAKKISDWKQVFTDNYCRGSADECERILNRFSSLNSKESKQEANGNIAVFVEMGAKRQCWGRSSYTLPMQIIVCSLTAQFQLLKLRNHWRIFWAIVYGQISSHFGNFGNISVESAFHSTKFVLPHCLPGMTISILIMIMVLLLMLMLCIIYDSQSRKVN